MPKESPDRGNADVRGELAPDPNAVVMPATPMVESSTTSGSVAAELKAPADHARTLKGVKTVKRAARVNGEPEEFELFHWQHSAAEALHGWRNHEHHEQKPIAISFEDYKSALLAASHPVTRLVDANGAILLGSSGKPLDPVDSYEAAMNGKLVRTDYEPHAPALSIHKEKG
jgi:hypothetical protein